MEWNEDAMRARLAKLKSKGWLLLTVPGVVIAYSIVTIAGPALVRAVVPEAVRSVLRLI
jgi:hypothetical protein